MSTVPCPSCGTLNPPESFTCSNCWSNMKEDPSTSATAPAAPAVPPPPPATAPWAPTTPTAPPATTSGSSRKKSGLVTAGVVLLAVIGVRTVLPALLAGHMTLPGTVAGLSLITTGSDAQTAQDLEDQMKKDVKGTDAGAYGNDGTATYFVVAAPGEEPEDTYIADFRSGFLEGGGDITLGEQTTQPVGGIDFSCADVLSSGQVAGAVCLWDKDTRGAVVSLTPDMEKTAEFSAAVKAEL